MFITNRAFQQLFYSPPFQEPTGTTNFFTWYFYGLGGLGGWLIFLVIALAAALWLFYDSGKRRLPALGWRMGMVLLILLLLPTIIYRFTVTPLHYELNNFLEDVYDDDEGICPMDVISVNYPELGFTGCEEFINSLPPLTPYAEWVFYLGLLGGVLAPVLAAGYYVTFQGMQGCPDGHVYDVRLGKCPDASHQPVMPPPAPVAPAAQPPPSQPTPVPPGPRPPSKPRVNEAWLVDVTNDRRYDLYQGITRLGRGEDNDILIADPAVSRGHAQIRETHGHFTLSDLGSRSGIYLNGRKLRAPQVLQNRDEITLGDTVLKFVSSR